MVDTNVLVYAADKTAPEHQRCRAVLEEWRLHAGAWFLTWEICYEFLRVVTHPRVFRNPWNAPDAWAFLNALRESPSLSILTPTERHADVLGEIVGVVPQIRGNLFHAVETVALMREHGISRIFTRDTDFHRFPFVQPLDPMVVQL